MNLTTYENTTKFPACPLFNVDALQVLSLPYNQDYNRFLVAFIAINALVGFLSTCSNFAVIFVVLRTKSLQTPSNILILGLAVSDFVVASFVQPSYCVWRFAELTRDFSLFCLSGVVYNLSIWTLVGSSFFTLTAITADRFLAVYLHLRYNEIVTIKRCVIVIAVIWVMSPVLCVIRLFAVSKGLIIFGAFFLACLLLVNGFFIFKISRVTHRHSVQIRAQQQATQQSTDMPRYEKSVNTMYYVIGAFFLCYVPFVGTLILLSVFEYTHAVACLVVLSTTLIMFNGMLNPIIYCWRIKEIRNNICRLIQQLWKRNETETIDLNERRTNIEANSS